MPIRAKTSRLFLLPEKADILIVVFQSTAAALLLFSIVRFLQKIVY
jgi:hypothetical protein